MRKTETMDVPAEESEGEFNQNPVKVSTSRTQAITHMSTETAAKQSGPSKQKSKINALQSESRG